MKNSPNIKKENIEKFEDLMFTVNLSYSLAEARRDHRRTYLVYNTSQGKKSIELSNIYERATPVIYSVLKNSTNKNPKIIFKSPWAGVLDKEINLY